jgi:hypothetical protein
LRTAMRPSAKPASSTQVPLLPLKLLIRHRGGAFEVDTVCASEVTI